MDLKDILTLILASIAIAVSLYTFYTTNKNKKIEDERTLRALMNDTVQRILNTIIDQQKAILNYQGNPHRFEASGLADAFGFQLQSLARLAVYISSRIPGLVSDVELSIIANAFARTNDQQQALEYWEKAISASEAPYYEMVNRRLYGRYLFQIGKIGDGREEFKRALSLFPIREDDLSRNVFGTTYLVLGMSEHLVGNEKSANDAFDKAAEAYRGLSSERMKNFALNRLANARKLPWQAPVAAPPAAPPPGQDRSGFLDGY